MEFKDYFSTQSTDYARYRPRYPAALFEYLAAAVPEHERAWDCATGSGQAALALTQFFRHVVATDASASQLANATGHERVTYRRATAEKTDIESGSVDLITVAQALHWFDLGRFYDEAKRVLKRGGVLAAWCYNLLEISPEIDAKVNEFYGATVGPYWPPERRLIEDEYRSIDFPFEELDAPRFYIREDWSLADLAGYLRTWSATQRFIEANGFDPVDELADDLCSHWGKPEQKRLVRWPVHMRAGRLRA